jgi:hypothetical protein
MAKVSGQAGIVGACSTANWARTSLIFVHCASSSSRTLPRHSLSQSHPLCSSCHAADGDRESYGMSKAGRVDRGVASDAAEAVLVCLQS